VSRKVNWEVVVEGLGIEAANCLFQVDYSGESPDLRTQCKELREALELHPGSSKYGWLRKPLDVLFQIWIQSVNQRVAKSLSPLELLVENVLPFLLMPVHSEALCTIDGCDHQTAAKRFRGMSLLSTFARIAVNDGEVSKDLRTKLPKRLRGADSIHAVARGAATFTFTFQIDQLIFSFLDEVHQALESGEVARSVAAIHEALLRRLTEFFDNISENRWSTTVTEEFSGWFYHGPNTHTTNDRSLEFQNGEMPRLIVVSHPFVSVAFTGVEKTHTFSLPENPFPPRTADKTVAFKDLFWSSDLSTEERLQFAAVRLDLPLPKLHSYEQALWSPGGSSYSRWSATAGGGTPVMLTEGQMAVAVAEVEAFSIESAKSLALAVRRIVFAHKTERMSEDRLVDAVIAIENLVCGGKGETTLQAASATAWLLEPTAVDERREVYAKVKKAYDCRSKLVHGEAVDRNTINLNAQVAQELSVRSLIAIRASPDLLHSKERFLELVVLGRLRADPPNPTPIKDEIKR
jgi:Apea-like HEPN